VANLVLVVVLMLAESEDHPIHRSETSRESVGESVNTTSR